MNKTIVVILSATLLLTVGMAFWQSGKVEADVQILDQVVAGIEVDPENYNLGDVVMKDGNVTKTYEVKNVSGNTLKLKKIATSCMCTEAKVKIGDKETKLFGMEGHGDRNPPVNLEIPAGETALVTTIFDPAAHGPQGVGPFDRVIWLTFSDPAGIKELKFNGTVVN